MKKKIILLFPIIALLTISLIYAGTISEIKISSQQNNYTIFINNSITLKEWKINSTDIMFYNISSAGNITNLNDTYNAKIFLFNLDVPNNDIRWDNGTIIQYNQTNTNITIIPSRYIQIGNFDSYVTPTPPTPPGGGGGITTTRAINLSELKYNYSDWIIGGINKIFIYTYDTKGNLYDVELVNITIKDVDYDIDTIRKEKGFYESKILIIDNVSEVDLEISAKDSYKIITEKVKITLREPTQYEEIKNKINLKISEFDGFFEKYKVYIIVIFLIFLISFFWFLFLNRKKKKSI